jgi:hypothetical protein
VPIVTAGAFAVTWKDCGEAVLEPKELEVEVNAAFTVLTPSGSVAVVQGAIPELN